MPHEPDGMSPDAGPRRRDPLLMLATIAAAMVVVVTVIAALTWRTPILHRDIHGHPLVATEATLDVTLTRLSPATITVPQSLVGIQFRNSTSLSHDVVINVPVLTIDATGSGNAGTDGAGDVVVQLPPHGEEHVALLPRFAGRFAISCSGSPDGMQGTLAVTESLPTAPTARASASAADRMVMLRPAAARQRLRDG
jgi:hypothetical protein